MSTQPNELRSISRKPALRRYMRRYFVLLALYMLLVAAINGWLGWQPDFAGPLGWLIAMSPALPIGGVLWAMGRYLDEEEDEFLRMMNVRANLLGGGLTLFALTAWSFLDHFAHVAPPRPALIFPIFIGLWACALAYLSWKNR